MKTKILNWIKANRLTVNIIAKFTLTAIFITLMYLFLFTDFLFVLISILVSTVIATATYLLWNKEFDFFNYLDKK